MGKSSRISNIPSSNGGVMGSGVFGLFGTTIRCDSKDESIYCNLMKLFNLLIVIMVFIYIFYVAYTYVLRPYFMSKRR